MKAQFLQTCPCIKKRGARRKSFMAKTCKRLGCGKEYAEESNEDTSCLHHPGWPIFSNLSKQWTCCKAEKYEWDDFMKVPGCATAKHSDIKPVQVKPSETVNLHAPRPVFAEAPKPIVASAPAPVPEAAVTLKPLLTESGKYKCANTGCNKEYDPEENSENACNYHPGKAIFRDTKKHWTCCEKHSYDWDDFVKLSTCQAGKHVPKTIPA